MIDAICPQGDALRSPFRVDIERESEVIVHPFHQKEDRPFQAASLVAECRLLLLFLLFGALDQELHQRLAFVGVDFSVVVSVERVQQQL